MQEPWSIPAGQVLQDLGTSSEVGLSQAEAEARLKKFGPNRLVKERTVTFWGVFREEVTEPMILLLLVVGVFYSVWGEVSDVITIFAIITTLVFAEVFTEFRAKRAITALRKLSPTNTPVLRGGNYMQIPSAEVVKGDIIPVEVGDKVPADARVLDSFGLQTDESPLTGESMPVIKEDVVIPGITPVTDRRNMVFAGTTVTGGRGLVAVTATGMATEMGKITGMVLEAKEPRTPLQAAMRQLAGFLVWIAVSFSILIPLLGIIQGKDYKEMILTGLSLSFAVIPEELPIIITMVLGVGALALSRRHVLIRRLRAAETLGGVTVIVTDKTGTITENKMTLVEFATNDGTTAYKPGNLAPADMALLNVGILTSQIKKTAEGHYTGDPLEVALLEAAELAGVSPEELQKQYSLQAEFSFDNRRKMASAIYKRGNEQMVYAKGAPEIILAQSSRIARSSGELDKTQKDETRIIKQAETMAGEARRVIAFAYKKVEDGQELTQKEAEKGLVFLGLVGMVDPPRAGVPEAIRATKMAGIRTIVVSGDLPLTVQKIASEVGIDGSGKLITGAELSRMDENELAEKVKEVSIFGRIDPEQKLKIVQALQKQGEVIAVTGDGINDAPALKSADIGVAMGERGTEVAREAASMVLTDDSYNSIVDGVREGRKIFDNLRKGVAYYLSVKIALVLTFVVALALNLPFPFAPIQIVLLELFMDLAASVTFVAEPIEADAMNRPPRSPKQKFIDREMLTRMSLGSVCLSVAVLINYMLTWYSGQGLIEARSVAFGTWLIGHVFLAFTMRSQREPLTRIGVFSNKIMLIWAAAAICFVALVTNFSSTQATLKVAPLDLRGWLLALGVPFVTVFWLEIRKTLTR